MYLFERYRDLGQHTESFTLLIADERNFWQKLGVARKRRGTETDSFIYLKYVTFRTKFEDFPNERMLKIH